MSGFTTTEIAPGHLALQGELGIFHAHEIKTALLSVLDAGDVAMIDLSGISEIDSCGVQLMLLARREARTRGKSLHWRGHSHAVAHALDSLNLGAAFDAPAVLLAS
ncbi:MAG: STAS domain-containing protein [Rhodocyclaceae bacterium]